MTIRVLILICFTTYQVNGQASAALIDSTHNSYFLIDTTNSLKIK